MAAAAAAGRIVNIASTYGVIARAAVGGVLRFQSRDHQPHAADGRSTTAPQGLRVNALCPGYIDTGLGRRGPTLTPEQFAAATTVRETAAALQPLGRQGTPAEVGSVAVFLASPEASFITGAILPVDGGCIITFNYGAASN